MMTKQKETPAVRAGKRAAQQATAKPRGYYFDTALWPKQVIEGKATDHGKLIEHGVRLGLGQRWQLARLKLETLRGRVAAALKGE